MNHSFRLVLFLLICTGGLAAQESRLRLDELLEEALQRNPEILAAQKRYEAARQRPSQAGSLPDPMFSLGYTSNGNPRPFAGLGVEPTSNAGFMLTQEIPFPGKRKLRGDIARKESEAEFEQYHQAQLNVISRLKQAYHKLHHTYETIEVLSRNRELLRRFLRISEARYAVGRATQQDVLKAQTQLSILETRILRMEQDKRSQQAEINSLLNRRHSSPLAQPVDIEPGEFRLTLETLMAEARDNAPALRREEKMIQRSELAVNLARKDYYPDYALSAGYFNMGRMPDMYQFRVDFKLPAFFWRKQRAMVAESSHLLGQARREYQALSQAIEFRLKDEFLIAETSHRLMNLYGNTVIPQASLTLESSIPAYEAGTVDFLTLLTNLMTMVDYEENYHQEMLSFHLALIRLEEITGLHLIDEAVR